VGIRKTNASDSLLKCRLKIGDIRTGGLWLLRDELVGVPFTGHSVSGMEAT
jgi:hypothetical protein